MPAPKADAIYRSILLCAFAAAAVLGMLWALGEHAASTQALTRSTMPGSAPFPAEVPCPWPSTAPITTVITKDPTTWVIASHGVTITFGPNYYFGNQEVTVTFLPQCAVPGTAPLLASSYYFTLTAVYPSGGVVSFQDDYEIALHYDPAQIGEAQEGSLRCYYEEPWPPKDWIAQPSVVDTTRDTLVCMTDKTGLFALAGYRDTVYLPLVLKNNGP